MEEPSSFDILINYPVKHGLEFDTHRDYRRFYLNPQDRILNTKFVIFKTGSLFFYAYDSYAVKAYMTKTYTGLYSSITLPADIELKVYKKDFADTFLRANKRKTGFKHIDEYLTVTSRSKDFSFALSKGAVSLFLEMTRLFSPFHMIVQNDYLPNIGELKNNKVIGLETQQWLFKEEDIDQFLKLGEEIIHDVITANLCLL